MERVLTDPVNHDGVYQCAQRLFRAKSDLNLSRIDKRRFEIRDFAEKRFKLGYPPRKKNDTSLGDAIHWEWLIDCAKRHESNVLIVSRDGDFGSSHGGHDRINDWLSKEFRERVGRNFRVELSKKLSDAMERFEVEVSAEDKEEEIRLLETPRPTGSSFRMVANPLDISNFNRLLQGLDPANLMQSPLSRAAEAALTNPLLSLYKQSQFSAFETAQREIEKWERIARLAESGLLLSSGSQDSDDEDEEEAKKEKREKERLIGLTFPSLDPQAAPLSPPLADHESGGRYGPYAVCLSLVFVG